jgi:hypothetical protein
MPMDRECFFIFLMEIRNKKTLKATICRVKVLFEMLTGHLLVTKISKPLLDINGIFVCPKGY